MPYGNSSFNHFRNCQPLVQSGCTIFIPTKPVYEATVSSRLHPHQHLLVSIFPVSLVGVTSYLVVVWTYISLITSGVEHIFTFIGLCLPPLGKMSLHVHGTLYILVIELGLLDIVCE